MSGVISVTGNGESTITGPASPSDDPLQSMQKMDEQVQKNESDTPVGQPSTPCQNKIEVTLYTADGEPLANAPYTITLDDGTVKSGTLDDKGYVLIERATLNEGAQIRVTSVTKDDGTETLKIEVGASVEPNPDDDEKNPRADVVGADDVIVPWEPY